uniref:Uncharacterized protein n=1 Tax=Asterionellopsis glacialis TaxID=33640 RepID=A0A7S0PWN6_9STRA
MTTTTSSSTSSPSPPSQPKTVTLLTPEMERNDESPLPPSQIMVTPEEHEQEQELRRQVLYKMRLQQLGNHHIAQEKLRVRKENWKKNIKEQQQQRKGSSSSSSKQQQQQQQRGGVVEEEEEEFRGNHQMGKLLDFVSCGSLVATCHEYADVGSIVDPQG